MQHGETLATLEATTKFHSNILDKLADNLEGMRKIQGDLALTVNGIVVLQGEMIKNNQKRDDDIALLKADWFQRAGGWKVVGSLCALVVGLSTLAGFIFDVIVKH